MTTNEARAESSEDILAEQLASTTETPKPVKKGLLRDMTVKSVKTAHKRSAEEIKPDGS